MYQFPVGVILESFKAENIATAMKIAADLKMDGFQAYATTGELAPQNMTPGKRKEFKKMADGYGLTISALAGDFGVTFDHPETNDEYIEKSKRVMDLAKDLNVNVVTTHIGVVPPDKNHPRYAILQESCAQLAAYADSVGAFFAIETGPELSMVLKEFLDSLGSKGLSVNLDPANLVMVHKEDPAEAVYNLRDYIVHTHAKDGINLKPADPEQVYGGVFDHDNPVSDYFEEVPLGQGGVNFPKYLAALEDIGYQGYLTIEREVGGTPKDDIILARDFLRKITQG